jgi:hypothetical protein
MPRFYISSPSLSQKKNTRRVGIPCCALFIRKRAKIQYKASSEKKRQKNEKNSINIFKVGIFPLLVAKPESLSLSHYLGDT